jgi:hypothetical protein
MGQNVYLLNILMGTVEWVGKWPMFKIGPLTNVSTSLENKWVKNVNIKKQMG